MSQVILGAGLAGLLAGNIFQRAKIFESGSEGQVNHKAVLRFRTPEVGAACGIDFRKVCVRKGIYFDNRFVAPDIRLANYYSQKVIGRLADRSVWKVEPAERFIAPADIVAQMAERCVGRIQWNCRIDSVEELKPNDIVSTIPMPVMAGMLGVKTTPVFGKSPILVKRWRIHGADVFQTVYFPDPHLHLYRASITGDLLISEYANLEDSSLVEGDLALFEAFGLEEEDADRLDGTRQGLGKIAPIDDQWRKNFIMNATNNHNIYSVGRFAVWKNLIMDDVLHDIHVVKRLMNNSSYERSLR